jgi:sulfur-carrier protein adenylyltransferase/sulfurtransferase
MVEELSASELARRLRDGSEDLLVLDVREPFERELAQIDPSVHIPMGEVPARLAEIPRDREVIVYCHMGGRSAMVAAFLEGRGYARVANLTGGIDAWSREVDANVARYA